MLPGVKSLLKRSIQYLHILMLQYVKTSSSHSLGILRFEPVEQRVLVEGSGGGAVAAVPLDVGDGVGVLHHLDEPHLVPGGQAAIWDHPVGEIRSMRSVLEELLLGRSINSCSDCT